MPQHLAWPVIEFVAAQGDRRLIEYLPGDAPELNPVEYLWGYWQHQALPNCCRDKLTELGCFGCRALQRMRRRSKLIRSL